MTDASTAVTYTLEGDVAVIRVDDGKANALSHELIDAIRAGLDRATAEAKAVALIGREGKFCAGFDLTVMRGGVDAARGMLKAGAELGQAFYLSPIPVVMGCTGHALAMGAILLFCADVRIGAEGPYKIGMNEVAIGMPVPRFAVTLAADRLSKRHLGPATLLARVYDPASAIDAGYLDQTVPLEEVDTAAVAEAARLAGTLHLGPFALTREYVRGDTGRALETALAADMGTFLVTEA